MNWDQIDGKWTEIKGSLQEKYGDLTNDELEEARGERTQLVGLLQQKYGKAKDEAEKELDEFINSF